MRSSEVLRTALDWSLCLLLIPAAVMSVGSLVVGVSFGFNLWRPERLFATLVWAAVVLFPGFLVWALMTSFKAKSAATTICLAAASWAFVVFAVWDLYVSHFGW